MSGNRIGGLKARDTNIKRHGRGFYGKIGKLGGTKGRGHAFGHGRVDPSEAGRKGGKISSREGVKNGTNRVY